jgi:hypothetical protein
MLDITLKIHLPDRIRHTSLLLAEALHTLRRSHGG